jgi:hypothetical protein
MTPTCHRCKHPAERSERFDAYFCGRCGLWLEGACGDPKCGHCTDRPPEPPAVAEPTPKPATYEVAVDALRSAENVRVTKRRGHSTLEEIKRACRLAVDHGKPLSYDGFQMEHEDGWIYEYTSGEKPRRVRRSTSAKDPK